MIIPMYNSVKCTKYKVQTFANYFVVENIENIMFPIIFKDIISIILLRCVFTVIFTLYFYLFY